MARGLEVRDEEGRERVDDEIVEAKLNLIEEYYVKYPFQKVEIILELGTKKYNVVEPPLSRSDIEIINWVKRTIEYRDDDIPLSALKDQEASIRFIMDISRRLLSRKRLPEDKIPVLQYYLVRDLAGYGRIDVLMNDPNIEDISCSGVNLPVYVWHRRHGYIPTNIVFTDPNELEQMVYKLAVRAKKMISMANPTVDGILPDKSRVVCSLGVVSLKGPSFTIRKYTAEPLTIIDLIRFGTVSLELAVYLWFLMEYKKSIIVSGEVGAGKTTLSNAILGFVRKSSKIITVEETPEIRLDGYENWTQKVTRESIRPEVRSIDLFELVKTALRERPDYVIVGEVRGREAYVLFQAIALGHGGITTLHADNVEAAIKRLTSKPLEIPTYLIALTSCFITINKFSGVGGEVKRRVVEVKEIESIEGENVKLHEVFTYNASSDKIEKINNSLELRRIASEAGFTWSELMEEYRRRESFLALLSTIEGLTWTQFTDLIESYHMDREGVFEKVRREAGL